VNTVKAVTTDLAYMSSRERLNFPAKGDGFMKELTGSEVEDRDRDKQEEHNPFLGTLYSLFRSSYRRQLIEQVLVLLSQHAVHAQFNEIKLMTERKILQQ
jgi:hypothetical protein